MDLKQAFEKGAVYSENIPGYQSVLYGLCRRPDTGAYYAQVQFGLGQPEPVKDAEGDLFEVIAVCEAHLAEQRKHAKPDGPVTRANAKSERERLIAERGGIRFSIRDLSAKARGETAAKDGAGGGESSKLAAQVAELSATVAELRQAVNVRLDEFDQRIEAQADVIKSGRAVKSK